MISKQRSSKSRSRRLLAILGAIALAAGSAIVGGQAATAQQFTGTTLYQPNTGVNSKDSASYPAMLRLQHSGAANGTILATHDFYGSDVLNNPGAGKPTTGLPVYRSTDGGSTWSVISHISKSGALLYFASLFEAPQQLGSYPAGTLFAGATALGPTGGSYVGVNTEDVFVSTNSGTTWSYLSSCDTQPSYTLGHGIWENTFAVSSSGALVCYYSDERDSGGAYPQYSQLIVHRTSTDGGVTWGPRVIDVAPVTNERPGMASLAKLPSGTYLMSFEVCGDDALHCATYLKSSADGVNWGTASSWGTRIATADGRWLEGNPYLTWSPAGGPQGTLIAHGRTVRYQQVGTSLPGETPESETTLFVNTNGGVGAWSEIPAPFGYSPLGAGDCPGYRASMLPSASGNELLYMAPILVSSDSNGSHCAIRYGTTTIGTLPYYAPLDGGTDAGFTTYNGTWSVSAGAYHNTSAGLGDKAVTGSTGWSDYSAQTDVRFDSLWSGASAGLIVRVTNPYPGTDAYTGYYVGLDGAGKVTLARVNGSTYNALVTTTASLGTVTVGTWYHLTVQVVGCTFNVSAQPSAGGTPVTLSQTDSGCVTSGQVGVRTFGSSTSWRGLAVTPGGTATYTPVYAPWESGSAPGWTTYGGTWAVSGGTYVNSSGGAGDKSLTGSSSFGNNTVASDVKLTSSGGNAGVVARVTSPGVGADNYLGYYAGISSGGQLLLGRANGTNYTALSTVNVPRGVTIGQWYRVTLQHVGCTLTATAQSTAYHDKVTTSVVDTGCYTNGFVGVRTYSSTATWRFFSMLPR